MRQLSALDAQFLNFETATHVANVGGLAILAGPVAGRDVLALLRERMDGIPQLRRRLVRVPFGLDHPYWAGDEAVDFDYHVRELALPAPGDDEQLGEQVGRLHERPLDRARPLWEMYLIHGLTGGRSAVYTKLHHAAVDGLTGAEMLSALVDRRPCPPCRGTGVPPRPSSHAGAGRSAPGRQSGAPAEVPGRGRAAARPVARRVPGPRSRDAVAAAGP
ncbi:hypothetical protein OIE66_18070 [Nonomuraea sp. NBC_01738]|uniref:wax ester/triacylglycerol synthase domain-containing protein n=1 Tax=Nonomuraea sp. NBC_01738 TaxID=2976003 RepID=UPI002E0D1D65|nr:hypothetical protein OIE66_18070 [Nonomuraea sp. NBC_01738]